MSILLSPQNEYVLVDRGTYRSFLVVRGCDSMVLSELGCTCTAVWIS